MLFEPGSHVPSLLAEELKRQFKNQTLPVYQIKEFVEDKTLFLASHMKKALVLLEREGRIRVSQRKQGNTKRTYGFSDGVIVTFKPQYRQQSLL